MIIDPHYELKHSRSINDEIILALVKLLHGFSYEPVAAKENYQYFNVDGLEYQGKRYRLIWVLEKDESYIGIINAFRRD